MADTQTDVLNAMGALPRPITREAALAAAAQVLAPLGLEQQFREWFKQNGDAVLRRLNGR